MNLKRIRIADIKGKGKGVIANKDFKKNDIILPIAFDSIRNRIMASDMSIQVDEDEFLESDKLSTDRYFNHICSPNMKIDFEKLIFVALRDIKKGEEPTWNYLTTEYDMEIDNEHFDCICGSKNCLGKIKGFRFLTYQQQLALEPFLSLFLQKKLQHWTVFNPSQKSNQKNLLQTQYGS